MKRRCQRPTAPRRMTEWASKGTPITCLRPCVDLSLPPTRNQNSPDAGVLPKRSSISFGRGSFEVVRNREFAFAETNLNFLRFFCVAGIDTSLATGSPLSVMTTSSPMKMRSRTCEPSLPPIIQRLHPQKPRRPAELLLNPQQLVILRNPVGT